MAQAVLFDGGMEMTLLWRMAFPLLTMIFGVFVGITLGNFFAQGDMNALRDQVETVNDRLAQSEVNWLSERNEFLKDQEDARLSVLRANNNLQELEAQNGRAFAAIDSFRSQLASCRNDMNLALSELENARQELDSVQQSCTPESQ